MHEAKLKVSLLFEAEDFVGLKNDYRIGEEYRVSPLVGLKNVKDANPTVSPEVLMHGYSNDLRSSLSKKEITRFIYASFCCP